MLFRKTFCVCFLLVPLTLWAQDSTAHLDGTELAVSQHQIQLSDGSTLRYTVHAGYLPIRDEAGEQQAQMYFTAYTKDGVADPKTRPITSTFNGGPGSSSVWLHLGGLAPKRVKMDDEGRALPPPYELIDNPHTWLDDTDLVFIDPVATGYSRAADEADHPNFHGLEEDIASVGAFIRLYTTKFERWASPKFLCGESYGTTRAAGLSAYLQDQYGMYLNGVILVSAVLHFVANNFDFGNDVPPMVFLPTYAATARYHGLLRPTYQNMPLTDFLREVEDFALTEYALALLQGDQATPQQRASVIEKLHQYTGFSKDFLDRADLRIHEQRFFIELQRDRGLTTGRLDSRFTGKNRDGVGTSVEFDPSYAAIYGPYAATLNDYLRRDLGYQNDLPYEILTGRVRPWSYATFENHYVDVAERLRQAMHKNPALNVWIANGYYDVATPYFATEYVLRHMGLAPEVRQNVTMTYYESGHMMYIHKPSLIQMDADAAAFYRRAVPNR